MISKTRSPDKIRPAFLISGTHSGVGKTTASFILMSLLQKEGYLIQPFKHGPDFIDPGYHRLATGRNSINLDFWMMGSECIIQSFKDVIEGADIGVIEAMGALFDGQNGTHEGSPAHLAATLSIPIILIVDIAGMTRSVNALLQGFLDFDPNVKIAGIIFNRAGSRKHYEMILDSLLPRFRDLLLGYFPYFSSICIPERHLGLLTVDENPEMVNKIEACLEIVKNTVDIKKLLDTVSVMLPPHKHSVPPSRQITNPSKIRLGVARDQAFCFYYWNNLTILEDAGAELVYFSPLEDKQLPQDLDGIYLGGGYPEVFAQQLSENVSIRTEILEYANAGMPIYAECGGLIYLCEKLSLSDESTYPMVNIFPYTIKWEKNYLAIRYVNVKILQECILGGPGLVAKGQEFHQTRMVNELKQQGLCYKVTSSTNEMFCEGYSLNNVLASYIHLYFHSEVADHFVAQCEKYRMEKPVYAKK